MDEIKELERDVADKQEEMAVEFRKQFAQLFDQNIATRKEALNNDKFTESLAKMHEIE